MTASVGTSHAPGGTAVGALRGALARASGAVRVRDGLGPAHQVAAAAAASAAAAVALAQTGRWYVAVGIVGAIGLVSLGFLRPAAFLLLFVAIRPVLDEWSTATLGVAGANVAGATATLLIVLAVGLLVRRPAALSTPSALAYGFIVVITAGCSAIAMWNFGGTVGTEPVSETVRILSVLAMYVLAANVLSRPDRIRRLLVAAGLSGVVPAVWGLIEWPTLGNTGYAIDIARVSGPFVGPNPLGQYLALTSLILIAMPRGWLSAKVRYLALAPQVLCIVPTYSRVGWIMLVVGVAILEWRRRRGLVLGMAVAVTAVVLFVPTVHDRLLPSSTPSPGSVATYESYSWRLDNWRTLLGRWAHEPFVGYGTGTTIFVNPRRTTLKRFAPDGGFEAHNLVVRVLIEGGLALALAYLIWAVVLFASLRRMIRTRWSLRPVAQLAAVLWFLQLLVGLLTDDPFGNTAVLFVLFAITGALEGAYRAARRARPPAGREAAPRPYSPARPSTT